MPPDLKPCPFCGGAAEMQYTPAEFCQADGTVEPSAYNVYCFDKACPYHTVLAYGHPTADEALSSWNRRPLEDAATARVAELQQIIDNAIAGLNERADAAWREWKRCARDYDQGLSAAYESAAQLLEGKRAALATDPTEGLTHE